MPATIFGALIFSLVFFAIWCLKDALAEMLAIPAPIKNLLICALFLLFAYVTTRLV